METSNIVVRDNDYGDSILWVYGGGGEGTRSVETAVSVGTSVHRTAVSMEITKCVAR